MGLIWLWKCVEKWAGEIEIRNTKLEMGNPTRKTHPCITQTRKDGPPFGERQSQNPPGE